MTKQQLSELEAYHHDRGVKTFAKLGVEHYRRMGKISVQKRFSGMTKEQISDYFRKVRNGIKQ